MSGRVEIVVFNEFLRIVSTMGLALRVLLGFVRSAADARHRRRRAGWNIMLVSR